MFIVDQKRKNVVNLDGAVKVYIEGRVIAVRFVSYGDLILAAYDTPERAAEVFKQMLEECFPPLMMAFLNGEEVKETIEKGFKPDSNLMIVAQDSVPRVEKIERSCWYMPEE